MITKRIFATMIAVVAIYAFSSGATAALITFETEGALAGDNTALPIGSGFVDGPLTTTFGYDTGGDFVTDTAAFFESRADATSPNAYLNNTSGGFDGVGAAGGSWLLRKPHSGEIGDGTNIFFGDIFIVDYAVMAGYSLPTSISGELWDVDDSELVTVSAYDSVGGLLGSTSPASSTFDESGWGFSLADAGGIAQIRITGTTTSSAGVGFDNFDAFGVALLPPDPEPEPTPAPPGFVPEPSTFALAFLGLLSLGSFAWRRRKRA